MLCLSRHTQQEIFINETVRIVVLGIENGKVKLGLDAPKEIPIRRGEIPAERYQAPAKIESKGRTPLPPLPQASGGPISFGFVFQT